MKACSATWVLLLAAAVLLASGPGAAQAPRNPALQVPPRNPHDKETPDIAALLGDIKGPDAERPAVLRKTIKGGYLQYFSAPRHSAVEVNQGQGAPPEAAARAVLEKYKGAFGLKNPHGALVLKRVSSSHGRQHVRFSQTYRGIPVLGAEIIVHLDANGNLKGVMSHVLTNTEPLDGGRVGLTPQLTAEQAAERARAAVSKLSGRGLSVTVPPPMAESPVIYDPAVMGEYDPPALAWQTVAGSNTVLVNAASGEILMVRSLLRNLAPDRAIYDDDNEPDSDPTTPVRGEGDPPVDDDQVDDCYDALGYSRGFFYLYHDLDGWTTNPVKAYVRFCNDNLPYNLPCPYENSAYDPYLDRLLFGDGYSVVDDELAHEYAHGVVDLYDEWLYAPMEWQAIEESLCDMWAEFIDWECPLGTDGSGVKWLLFEDREGGAGRQMNDPSAYPFYDPDRYGSPYYYYGTIPTYYEHKNNGVNNKLIYLLCEGQSFRGRSVTAMTSYDSDTDKTVAGLYYEALVNYLSTSSDYLDLYLALIAAADALDFSAEEIKNIKTACRAVEIHYDSFDIRDDDNDLVMSMTGYGAVMLYGGESCGITEEATSNDLQPNDNVHEFLVRDRNDAVVARLRIDTGHLYLKGTVSESQDTPTPDWLKAAFEVTSDVDLVQCLIDENGNLKAGARVFVNGNLYDE